MAMKFCVRSVLLALALTLVLGAGTFAAMEKAEFINGAHWTKWSNQDKLVYIRGLSNWADFITEAQRERGNSSEFCISKVFVDELKAKSLGQIVLRLTYCRKSKIDHLRGRGGIAALHKACPPEVAQGAEMKNIWF
jgi:hypothetical protein